MCGIAGFVNFHGGRSVTRDWLSRACDVITHRGPDDEGSALLKDGAAGLGMRRLSVIDLHTGAQPMTSADGLVTIVFNGEIYNYPELKDEFKLENLRTTSDTEVFLRLYEKMGIGCLEKLRGMFGAAIWDGRTERLFLVRDRFGKKPVYYYRNHSFLLFGSEIKAILENSGVPRRVSEKALFNYLSWLAVPGPDTMFDGVYKLPPGHYMEVRLDGETSVRRYWKLEPRQMAITRDDAKDLLVDHLDEAVKIRLRADVDVGVLLSGGVDSSTIVALTSRHFLGRIRTFSVGFDIEGYNEFDYARMVAKRYGTDHTELRLAAEDYWDNLEQVVWSLDEPVADTATVPLYLLCRKAKESVKVLLSGEGSDEILGGYANRYIRGINTLGWVEKANLAIPEAIKDYLYKAFGGDEAFVRRPLLWKMLAGLEYQFLRNSIYGYPEGLRRRLFEGTAYEGRSPEKEEFERMLANGADGMLGRMQYVDTVVNLPAYLLMKADKMSMAASVELRCPFLDHRLAEYCYSLPDRYKLDMNQRSGKTLLKEAMEPYLPHEVLYRGKMGFPVPIDIWARGNMKEKIAGLLFDRESAVGNMFNKAFIDEMWRAHQSGKRNHGMQLWLLTLLEMWADRFGVGV